MLLCGKGSEHDEVLLLYLELLLLAGAGELVLLELLVGERRAGWHLEAGRGVENPL